MCILSKLCKLIYIVPYLFVVSVKDMSPVFVYMNPINIFSWLWFRDTYFFFCFILSSKEK